MTVNKKTFFVHFSHFFTGQASVMLIGFISFPILTRLLTVEEYGLLSLVTNTLALAVACAKAGLSDGIIRLHEEYTDNKERKEIFSTTVITGGILLSFFTSAAYLLILPHLFGLLSIQKQFQNCFYVMALYLFVRPLNIICLNLARANGNTLFINCINFINRFVSVLVGLCLLVYLVKSLVGYFVGSIIGEYLIFSFLAYWLYKNYRVNLRSFSSQLSQKLVQFGLPLLFSELAYLILTYADRYIIMYFHGDKELGMYSVGYNLAMYVADLVIFSVSYAIVPLFVKKNSAEGRSATEHFLEESFYYLLVGIIPICFGYHAVSKDIFVIMASEKYFDAALFSPLILYGSLFLGMNNVLNAGLYIQKKSRVIFAIICIAVFLNIFLNFIFVPRFHSMGAAWATLISCFFSSCLTAMLSFKYIKIKFRLRIVRHLVLGAIMYCAIIFITTDNLIVTLCIKLIVGLFITSTGVCLLEKEIAGKMKKVLLF